MPVRSPSTKHARASPYRSNAPTRSPGPPPAEPLPLPPRLGMEIFDSSESDSSSYFVPSESWAVYARAYSTLLGALALSSTHLKLLQDVPREAREEDAAILKLSSNANTPKGPVTRTRAMILAGQRIDFGFSTGGRALRHKGMPMYALASATEEELLRNMKGGDAKVMAPFSLRRIRIRIVWPTPQFGKPAVHEEWVRVDPSYTRVKVAMAAAKVFYNFVEMWRVPERHLAYYEIFPWRLALDAFYRVWLIGLERVESNLWIADLKYVKRFPSE